jgi:hypothetical protein
MEISSKIWDEIFVTDVKIHLRVTMCLYVSMWNSSSVEFRLFNARNIKGENTGQNTKMNYTPPITALSEMTEKIVRIRKYHHQQPPQTADLVGMATCHLSWAINIFSLHGFTRSKSTLKR